MIKAKKRVAYREKPEWEKALDNFDRSLRRRMKRIRESELTGFPVENWGLGSFYLTPIKLDNEEENEEEVVEDV